MTASNTAMPRVMPGAITKMVTIKIKETVSSEQRNSTDISRENVSLVSFPIIRSTSPELIPRKYSYGLAR